MWGEKNSDKIVIGFLTILLFDYYRIWYSALSLTPWSKKYLKNFSKYLQNLEPQHNNFLLMNLGSSRVKIMKKQCQKFRETVSSNKSIWNFIYDICGSPVSLTPRSEAPRCHWYRRVNTMELDYAGPDGSESCNKKQGSEISWPCPLKEIVLSNKIDSWVIYAIQDKHLLFTFYKASLSKNFDSVLNTLKTPISLRKQNYFQSCFRLLIMSLRRFYS